MSRTRDARPADLRVGRSVCVKTFGRIAVGRIIRIVTTEDGRPMHESCWRYIVRLPNWMADGVHLDTSAARGDLEVGWGRADVCRCVYCPGYGKERNRKEG